MKQFARVLVQTYETRTEKSRLHFAHEFADRLVTDARADWKGGWRSESLRHARSLLHGCKTNPSPLVLVCIHRSDAAGLHCGALGHRMAHRQPTRLIWRDLWHWRITATERAL